MPGKETKNDTPHKGHRDRLRSRFIEHGLESFNEINALELLLFYAIPQKDVNPIAHELLDRFGSLDGVFAASHQELCSVKGIKDGTAALIRLVPQILRKRKVAVANEMKTIRSTKDAGNYLLPRFMNEEDEVLYMVCLDTQKRVISCTEMGRGVVNAVSANIRKLVETALKQKASSVIIAHNHPDGVALPSAEDDAVTKQLRSALSLVDIQLTDHIIVAGDDYVSYRDSGMFDLFRW